MSLKVLLVTVLLTMVAHSLDICDYYKLTGKLKDHPECMKGMPEQRTTNAPEPIGIGFCSSSATLIQCTADSITCQLSGQVCIQSDGNKCCQINIPYIYIYIKNTLTKNYSLAVTLSGITGTPSCPADANAGLNCLFAHADACNLDSDCLGRENTVQPSCCMTSCGYKICYQY
uniref:CC domain-containing protein n=1 Tax=Heterorhabditis bacteriophora TaxID=37862 RepID=A0A1I7X366_HETBA